MITVQQSPLIELLVFEQVPLNSILELKTMKRLGNSFKELIFDKIRPSSTKFDFGKVIAGVQGTFVIGR